MKLPEMFREVLWSYDFTSIDNERDKRRIVINSINYGAWKHWLWIAREYGKSAVAEIIEGAPATEFRPGALKLACILFGAKKPIHASRIASARS